MKAQQIIIITGTSGSGKSTALDVLEDAGFYCIDNMPVALLPKLLKLPLENITEIQGLAFVMDMRDRSFISEYESVFRTLARKKTILRILFLEADEKILLRRFKETRRQHPLSQNKGLLESIRDEMAQLSGLRTAADNIINTSHYTVHELRPVILDIAEKFRKLAPMQIHVMSFGFKFGVPQEADMVIDVRFLANPHFVPELGPLTGESEAVKAFVLNQEETRIFMDKFLGMLDYLIPLYEKEGKSYLTIAVGCTGGRHRSVAVARAIFGNVEKSGKRVVITHRDISQ